ncbi:hypothetical protein E2L06_16330 [Haloterrigena sp. H1]|uniref:hypothetical protein n=1 Tax=Haloterrigena sp. H1 TaxID=2552943 RepID=UPI00110D4621|nr:hypothetical protein [Haloterrigena sp. H1]TMT81530.1 hypothetical protein E2L06_16330 [Haloterrigena sp. H1]
MPAETPHSTHDKPTALYFGYANTTPDLDAFDVKTVHPDTLLESPAVFTVIGESHYVGLPAFGFHELCSCQPVSPETAYETPLSTDVERTFRFDGDTLRATTTVSGRPMESFPGPEAATVAFRFDPGAWTTIRVDETRYETYHTYPEYGLALHTETSLYSHASHAERTCDETTTDTPQQTSKNRQ